jgi:hypothetical protein
MYFPVDQDSMGPAIIIRQQLLPSDTLGIEPTHAM